VICLINLSTDNFSRHVMKTPLDVKSSKKLQRLLHIQYLTRTTNPTKTALVIISILI
jgi:hypothetical protein